MKNINPSCLFWFKTPPYESLAMREGLDAALAFAAFDQQVELFFDAAAVPALFSQNAQVIAEKDISKNLKALGMYDIETVYAERNALEVLESGGLKTVISLKKVSVKELTLSQYQNVLVF